jgi:hypothetical protein
MGFIYFVQNDTALLFEDILPIGTRGRMLWKKPIFRPYSAVFVDFFKVQFAHFAALLHLLNIRLGKNYCDGVNPQSIIPPIFDLSPFLT